VCCVGEVGQNRWGEWQAGEGREKGNQKRQKIKLNKTALLKSDEQGTRIRWK